MTCSPRRGCWPDYLDISRNTVNRAYRELAVEGFIEPIERVGYVVNEGLREGDAGGRDRDGSSSPPRVRWDERLGALADADDERTRPADWRSYPYPFVVGPGPEAFPIGSWTRAMRMALREEHRGTSLHNLDDQDDPLLVEQIRRTILPARGIEATPDEILVTLGTQHGLHLVAEALLGPGSTVGVEDPGYPDAPADIPRAGREAGAVTGRRARCDRSRKPVRVGHGVRHSGAPVPHQRDDDDRPPAKAPGCGGSGWRADRGR